MDFIDELFSKWAEGDYVEPFYLLCASFALVTGFICVRKQKIGKFFIIYIALDLTIAILDDYINLFSAAPKKEYTQFLYVTNTLVSLIELTVYYYFFYSIIRLSLIKKFIVVTCLPFIVISIILIIKYFLKTSLRYVANQITVVEFSLLIILCFSYYFQLLKKPIGSLFKRPSFFIATGIFIFSIISLPFYQISHFFAPNNEAYDFRKYELFFEFLFYIPFSVNFILLSKAFLCRKCLMI